MSNIPEPSIKSLLLSFLAAIVLALAMLIFAILPAEYNIDPTGIGTKLGLTVLAQSSASVAEANVLTCLDNSSPTTNGSEAKWQDVVVITIPAKSGLEYKFHLNKDKAINYTWNTDGALLYFDFHGEPDGDHTGYFKSYQENTHNQSTGTLKVPFNGIHGWYWENKTQKPVKVILKTSGEYKVVGVI